MRKIKSIHLAIAAPIEDLETYRAMPTRTLEHIDPFLFLNHHGPQDYPPNNNGLPFGPHPHRGFETLTLILDGDVAHLDSSGGKDVIKKGGIQWMTAGSGVIHSEVSSEDFKKQGGREELIQLWFNLPAHLKMTEPRYVGLQKEEVPTTELDEGNVKAEVISGEMNGTRGGVESPTGLHMNLIYFKEGGKLSTHIPADRNILFYVINGAVEVNGKTAEKHQLVEFENEGEQLNIQAKTDARLIFGHGEPYNEPIVAHGPFVMNSHEEINQAIRDYQSGKMGTWEH